MIEERTVILARQLACALLALALGAAPCVADTGTFEHKLGNGLRVIVKPDRRSPVAVSILWYKVGSMDEVNGVTGVAHVLEHMMFKGTPTVPDGEYAERILGAGGRVNAFTNKEFTGYFQALHKSQLDLAFRLEADRMQNISLLEEAFAKEIKVIMEERRWVYEDQPHMLVYEQLMAALFTANPYRHPVIGWMSDLESMRASDVRAFYERWYAPNNALWVVVGDVEPTEVFALAEKYFAGIPAKALSLGKPQDEPRQLGTKRITVKAPAELPYVMMGYRVPALRDPERDWEPYALEMLAAVLGGNEAARLNSTLVRREQIANSVSASYDGIGRGPATFFLYGISAQGKSAASLEQGMRGEMTKIMNQGVTEEELVRARAQALAQHVFERDSMYFQARIIGALEIAGISHATLDLQLQKLRQVTPAQVQEVARKYFNDDVLTVAYLEPQPLSDRPVRAAPQGLLHGR